MAAACDLSPTEPLDFRTRLVGTVRNAVTNAPIEGATITLTKFHRLGILTRTTTSSASGAYVFTQSDMRTGEARLEVTASGFEPLVRTIQIIEDIENTVDIELTPTTP
jgi:hypothetical protein